MTLHETLNSCITELETSFKSSLTNPINEVMDVHKVTSLGNLLLQFIHCKDNIKNNWELK